MSRNVIIIGAGAAGLNAARVLHQAGVSLRILEATSLKGGRIRALERFADFPIELGAEEIHGEDSLVYQWAQEEKIPLIRPAMANDLLHLGDRFLWYDEALKDSLAKQALRLLYELYPYQGSDITVEDYLVQKHFPEEVRHFLDSRLGVEFGTTLNHLSLAGILQWGLEWLNRETNFTLNQEYLSIMKRKFAPVEPFIHYNTPVQSIDYRGERIRVLTKTQETFEADAVIVTVPLTVLKEETIEFLPELPREKKDAIHRIGMSPGMKIIFKFSKAFWPERLYFLHTEGLFPQFWVTSKGKESKDYVLTAFLGGDRAALCNTLSDYGVARALEGLDNIFGDAGNKVASRSLKDVYIANWGKEPYFRGLYSFPTPHTNGLREKLAEPLDQKIYFTGEATHTGGAAGTAHGALETGEAAALAILK
ncbi:MAG: FAD-dependent oxidoreductase [Verrucomicrobiae bacterium]|nr:FAD-dependent oxidoreductase [Verrucomicrobiae bacterium]